MLETLIVIVVGVLVLLGVIMALGAMGAVIFFGLLAAAFFVSKVLLFILVLLGVIAIPYLLIRGIARACRGRKIPGTPIPLGLVVIVALIAAFFAWTPSLPPKMEFNLDRALENCDGGGVDITLNGKTYHFSCRAEEPPPAKDSLGM